MKTIKLIILGTLFSQIGFSQYVVSVFDKQTKKEITDYRLFFVNERDTIIPEFINDSTLNVFKAPANYKLVIRHDSVVCKILHGEWYNNVRVGLDMLAKPTCIQGYTQYLDGNKISYSQDLDNKYGECRDNSHFVRFVETKDLKEQLQFNNYFIDRSGYSCYNDFKSINDTLLIENKDQFETITISIVCVLQDKIVQTELYDSQSKLGYEIIQEYSKTNKLKEFKMQGFDGTSYGRYENLFNETDKIVETKYYDRNGTYSGSTKINYNNQNKKVSQEFSDHQGNLKERKEFKYNSNDSLAIELTFNSESLVSKVLFNYGTGNKLITRNTYYNDKLAQTVIIKYLKSGLKNEELTYNNKNILIERTKYDQFGFVTETIRYNEDGTEKEYRLSHIIRKNAIEDK